MRFGGLSHEAIIETAATGRKRNTCIACMRQANEGTCRRRTSLAANAKSESPCERVEADGPQLCGAGGAAHAGRPSGRFSSG